MQQKMKWYAEPLHTYTSNPNEEKVTYARPLVNAHSTGAPKHPLIRHSKKLSHSNHYKIKI